MAHAVRRKAARREVFCKKKIPLAHTSKRPAHRWDHFEGFMVRYQGPPTRLGALVLVFGIS